VLLINGRLVACSTWVLIDLLAKVQWEEYTGVSRISSSKNAAGGSQRLRVRAAKRWGGRLDDGGVFEHLEPRQMLDAIAWTGAAGDNLW
jgi:hypothetical protein